MTPDPLGDKTLGVVVIGRNEGERLQHCLNSLVGKADYLVYVDSGSKDDSVAASRARGVSVVELDLTTPFTAARARNAGYERLMQDHPGVEYVFFVDGDCEVVSGWLDAARRFLEERSDVAVVCGRRNERYPDRSIYNMLIDLEWKVPPGEVHACGGDSVMRTNAFRQVSGFRASLICGEEPELCYRLRGAGWRIWCLDRPMTIHDAAIYRFGQWWMRSVRTGFGYLEVLLLYGASSRERFCVRECAQIWVWGFCVPAIVTAASIAFSPWALALLLVYPVRIARIFFRGKYSRRQNFWRALSLVACQFPAWIGQMKFVLVRLRGVPATLIEYK